MQTKQNENLFVNVWDYVDKKYPFQVFMGGRGTGKTYSALLGALRKREKFVLMRRTSTEIDIMLSNKSGEGANPFKSINIRENKNINLSKIVKNLAGIYDDNNLIGYAVALSTISSIRGIDLSDSESLIFDEFIPESHVKRLKEEGKAFLNAYETINRNREIEGKNPMKVFLLANSNNLYNPIFDELGIINIIEKMLKDNKQDYYNINRGLAVHILKSSDKFINEKSNTALYKLTNNTDFYKMSINNEFSFNDFSYIGHQNLKGYSPICQLDNFYIYRKKSTYEYYITYSRANVIKFNSSHINELRRFKKTIGHNILLSFERNKVIFESYEIKSKILDLLI